MGRRPSRVRHLVFVLFLSLFFSGILGASSRAATEPGAKQRADAHIQLGIQYGKQGELDKAIAEFKKAMGINPRNSAIYMNLGTAYATKGMFDEAIAAFERAIELKPTAVNAHMNLGLAYFYSGKLGKALGAYKQALMLRPDLVDAYRRMGQVYGTQGRAEEAVAAYEKVREARPRSAGAHSELARAYLRAARSNEAIAAARRAIELDARLVDARLQLAGAYEQSGRLNDALREYQQVLKLSPRLAAAHNRLGFVHLRAGRFEKAEVAFKHAVRLKPDFVEARYNLAWVSVTQGKVDAAIAQYQKILQIDSGYAPAYAALGDAYDLKGMTAEAKRAYAKYDELKDKVPVKYDTVEGRESRLRVYHRPQPRPSAEDEKASRQPFRLWQYRGKTTAEDFSLSTLDGKTLRLSDFRGKVVALNFWATWCAPCLREMPEMERLYQRYKEQGFAILGVSLDVDAKGAKAFMDELKVTYPSVIDPRRQVASRYRVWALPATHFIDRQGEIIGWFYGERQWDGGAARALIQDLVAGSRPGAEGVTSPSPRE